MYASDGHTDGNVMVANLRATGYSFEYHDTGLFDGDPRISAVPEPSSLVLAGLGVVGSGVLAWNRRSAAGLRVS